MQANLTTSSSLTDTNHQVSFFSLVNRLLFQSAFFTVPFLFVWFFLLYTEIPLSLGGSKFIPSVGFFILMPFVLPTIFAHIKLHHLLFIVVTTLLAIITLAVKFDARLISSSIIKILQLIYSLCIFVTTYLLLVNLPFVVVKQAIGGFLLFIIIGTILERLDITASLSQAFRTLYSDTLYGAEIDSQREINVAGFVRPYVFTSEPSFVGLGFFVFSSAYFFLVRNIITDLLILFSIFLMLVLLGSPTVAFGLLLLLPSLLLKTNLSPKKLTALIGTLIVVLGIFFSVGAAGNVFTTIAERITEELFDEASSIYVRVIVPYGITLPQVFSEYPLWGVGFGNYGYINLLFGYPFDYLEQDSVFIQGANGFVTLIVYFGIIGTSFLFSLLVAFTRYNKIKYPVLCILYIVIMSQILGGISTPRYWGFIAVFFAAVTWFGRNKLQTNKVINEGA
jgi:hypothetical protein